MQEAISVSEANKLGIPVIALVDTNSNPNLVDYPIPSNDDAASSIELLLHLLGDAIATGLTMRQEDKGLEGQEQEAKQQGDQDEQELATPKLRHAKKVMYTQNDLQAAAAYDDAQKKAIKSKLAGGVGRGRPTNTSPSKHVKKAPTVGKDLSKPNKSASPATKEAKPSTASPQAAKKQAEAIQDSAGAEQAS
jgi:small subunit ribosomal protein S2